MEYRWCSVTASSIPLSLRKSSQCQHKDDARTLHTLSSPLLEQMQELV